MSGFAPSSRASVVLDIGSEAWLFRIRFGGLNDVGEGALTGAAWIDDPLASGAESIAERTGDDGVDGECGRLRDLGVSLSVTIRELENKNENQR